LRDKEDLEPSGDQDLGFQYMDGEHTSSFTDTTDQVNLDNGGELDDSNKSEFYRQGVMGLASVCAFRLHTKYPYLRKVDAEVRCGQQAADFPGWVQPYCEQGTMAPSALLDNASKTMDEVFLKMHEDKYDSQPKVLQRFKDTCAEQNVGLPEEVVGLFGYLRILSRIRSLNRLDRKSSSEGNGQEIDKHSREAKAARIRRS
jgi:hypothetical protein